ncbi:DUF456 domain-containing protein [Nocardioides alcanivorans]|uniref:DUF456 domain-containing protein n=1 Tax=Nocardioides alcanivorans TaxID=2897352 RepID=UPI001F2ACB02|nr:DUF456 domain-containing protein [Nocardioides alcanivorans]
MTLFDAAVALAIAVGIAGIVVPVLPGMLLITAALITWGFQVGGSTAWTVTGIALALIVLGSVVKYAVPGRSLKRSGIPSESLLVGALLGIIGFFVVPVIGIVLGFVLGIYLTEARRVGVGAARGTTWAALKAAGLSILIEFCAAVAAAAVWAVGVVLT